MTTWGFKIGDEIFHEWATWTVAAAPFVPLTRATETDGGFDLPEVAGTWFVYLESADGKRKRVDLRKLPANAAASSVRQKARHAAKKRADERARVCKAQAEWAAYAPTLAEGARGHRGAAIGATASDAFDQKKMNESAAEAFAQALVAEPDDFEFITATLVAGRLVGVTNLFDLVGSRERDLRNAIARRSKVAADDDNDIDKEIAELLP